MSLHLQPTVQYTRAQYQSNHHVRDTELLLHTHIARKQQGQRGRIGSYNRKQVLISPPPRRAILTQRGFEWRLKELS
jgi:hypothetical protein